jgi:hypothetical protein
MRPQGPGGRRAPARAKRYCTLMSSKSLYVASPV